MLTSQLAAYDHYSHVRDL